MLKVIATRRSVRRFLPKPVEPEKIQELLKAAFFAPTAKNLRQTEFIVVENSETAAQLALATPYSALAKRAPLIIAVCYNTTTARRFQEDCAMAAQNIYLEAAPHGLGACYIQITDGTEAQVGPPEAFVKTLLGVPETHRVLCLMAIGYPETMPAPHADSEYDAARVHKERFGQS
jgi:nitroreductase